MENQKIMIDNKIADVILSKTLATWEFWKLQQNNSKTFINENDEGIPKEKNISPEERQTIIEIVGINIIV